MNGPGGPELQLKGWGDSAELLVRPLRQILKPAEIQHRLGVFFYVDSRHADAPGHDYQAQQ
jgi:hypothetical protein